MTKTDVEILLKKNPKAREIFEQNQEKLATLGEFGIIGPTESELALPYSGYLKGRRPWKIV